LEKRGRGDLANREAFQRSAKGYTLIEVLIATAIFGAMVTLASMALNQGLKQYQSVIERGLSFWDYARYMWIQRSFNSATDYYIYTRGEGWAPYFIGDQEGISYVSLAPLAGNLPVIVWIRIEKDNNGKRALVYYELPVYTKTYTEIERESVFGDYRKGSSVRLLEGVVEMQVSFYGYDLNRREYVWTSDYDGRKKRLLPILVKVAYVGDEHKNSLILGINVNSTVKMTYNEAFRGL